MNDIQDKREQAEAYFRKIWPRLPPEDVSDFGAYCVEKWLSGRSTSTSYSHLGVDYLRKFKNRYGARGSSDLMAQPTRIKYDPTVGGLIQLGSDSFELRRFDESSLLRDRRLGQNERAILILLYEWELTEKEVGDVFGVSESRISQMLHKTMRSQKKRIQADAASGDERERQRKEQEKISRQVQDQRSLDKKTQRIMEKIREESGCGVGEVEESKIQDSVQESFAIYSF